MAKLEVVIEDDIPKTPYGNKGGLAKAANSVQAKVKPSICEAYLAWQSGIISGYKNKTEFAVDMCMAHPEISDVSKVLNLIRLTDGAKTNARNS